jgi:integrase/recombinase XerD
VAPPPNSSVADAAARRFGIEGFRDYLGLEAGHSVHTVDNYLRDLRRFVRYAVDQQVAEPGAVTRGLLRQFVFELKDAGLSPATIPISVS